MEIKEEIETGINKPVFSQNTDFEVRSMDAVCINESELKHPWWHNLKYFAAGIAFGIILVKSEVLSWFRIQEMFRLQSFHMYGVIGSAVATGMLSVWLIKKFNVKTIYGEPIRFAVKKFNKGNIYGGLLLIMTSTGFCCFGPQGIVFGLQALQLSQEGVLQPLYVLNFFVHYRQARRTGAS